MIKWLVVAILLVIACVFISGYHQDTLEMEEYEVWEKSRQYENADRIGE